MIKKQSSDGLVIPKYILALRNLDVAQNTTLKTSYNCYDIFWTAHKVHSTHGNLQR